MKRTKSAPSDIEAELKELRKFKEGVESRNAAASNVKVFLAKLWAGPELSKSLEAWMLAREENDAGQIVTATANLIAAILRRLMRVSFIFILLASIPIILIIWQNIIMERQNQSLIRQIEAERTASSNQQVTEYLRLLLSDEEREVRAAEGFLVSDLVNRNLSIERLAALMRSGNTDVQCSALKALARIVETDAELNLKDVIAPTSSERLTLTDLQCEAMNFAGVDFGAITFVESGFPQSSFKSANVSAVEFRNSNLRHSDFSSAQLCRTAENCVRFSETDLSFASLTFTNRSKNVFNKNLILTGAQLTFGQDIVVDEANGRGLFSRDKQASFTGLVVPKIPKDSLIASGICYETGFSQCYLFHKARDLGQLDDQRLSVLRQGNCPLDLDVPIILTPITTCENLGLTRRW